VEGVGGVTKLSYILKPALERYLQGREIVLWGTGRQSERVLKDITYGIPLSVSFCVSRDYTEKSEFCGLPVHSKSVLDKKKYYAVIASYLYRKEIAAELKKLGFCEYDDYFDYWATWLPFDWSFKGMRVGKYSWFGNGFDWAVENGHVASIGRYTSINVSAAVETNHPTNFLSTAYLHHLLNEDMREEFRRTHNGGAGGKPLIIGNDVWIGQNTFINATKCKSIGDGAIIGAGAVVLNDVPPYAVAVGVPAKIKKYRYTPEQTEILLRIKWWEWDIDSIKENSELFVCPEKFFEKFKV
jgi:aminocyclitol acetyltransferase